MWAAVVVDDAEAVALAKIGVVRSELRAPT